MDTNTNTHETFYARHKRGIIVTAILTVVALFLFYGYAWASPAQAQSISEWDLTYAYPLSNLQVNEVTATSSANMNCTGTPKSIKNRRLIESGVFHTDLFWYRQETPWKYCNGNITQLYPAELSQGVYSNASVAGWSFVRRWKVRANCYGYGVGGEHCAWTHQFEFKLDPPGVPEIRRFYGCVTSQVRGDGRHYRHGSCSLGPWSGTMYG
jgi:hypothetical protein